MGLHEQGTSIDSVASHAEAILLSLFFAAFLCGAGPSLVFCVRTTLSWLLLVDCPPNIFSILLLVWLSVVVATSLMGYNLSNNVKKSADHICTDQDRLGSCSEYGTVRNTKLTTFRNDP